MAANAFYKQEQGQDISKEKNYYRNAGERFKEEFGETPCSSKRMEIKTKIIISPLSF